MAIVTLLSDSGDSDHYVAAIKGKVLSTNPGLSIIDISTRINPCDIGHGAFVLKSAFRDFPKGTVHIVAVDAAGNRGDSHLAIQLEDHYFVSVDNGLLGLISDKTPQNIVELNVITTISTSFPERDILAPAAARLASGVSITTLGTPLTTFKKMTDRHVKATKKQILGHVIRVDGFGNLITNIEKDTFELLSKGKVFTVSFGGEKMRRIHTGYHQADQGDCFLLFNSLGLLEIGIYKGNASDLLGLSYDSPVNIVFEE